MRWWKRWGVVVCSVTFFAGSTTACTSSEDNFVTAAETDPGPIETSPPDTPATCKGTCVLMPPATYTGPSFFTIEEPGSVADCPPTSPYQGIQGLVQDASAVLFARECLITPDPTCLPEGQTCVPAQDQGFRVCIHHDGDEPCDTGADTPADTPGELLGYPHKSRILNEASGEPVTLCCTTPLHMN